MYVMNELDRYYSHVKKTPTCWLWTGCKSKAGYGRLLFGGKQMYAHRVAYSLEHTLDPLLEIDHLCRNRACVNPEHLEQVTHSDNLLRSPKHVIHGSFNRPIQTHCYRGHLKERRRNGKLYCRRCNLDAVKEYLKVPANREKARVRALEHYRKTHGGNLRDKV